MKNADLQSIRSFLVKLAKDAGEILKSHSGKESFQFKQSPIDLVTRIDKLIEKKIFNELKVKYPEFSFIGEETYDKDLTNLGVGPTFIVDPIDGTTNFIHNFPFSCISIGFTINRKPVVGVIYNPHLNLMLHAVKGRGAYLNDEKFPPVSKSHNNLSLQSSLIALEAGSTRSGDAFDKKMATIRNLLDEEKGFIHGSRSFGASTMNLFYVATGQLDAYWDGGCQSWDVCAGWIILEETGGIVVSGIPNKWEVSVDSRVYLFVRGASERDQKQFVIDFWGHVSGDLFY